MTPDELDASLRRHFRGLAPSEDFDRHVLARIARESAAAARFDRVQALERAARRRDQELMRLRRDTRESWFWTSGTVLATIGIAVATAPAWQSALAWAVQPTVLTAAAIAAAGAVALAPRLRGRLL